MATGGNRICSVFACTGDTIDTCGKRYPDFQVNSTAVFEEISIEAVVPKPQTDGNLNAADSTFYPISLDTSIMPLNSQQYTYERFTQDSETMYSLKLNSQIDDIYCFAIWGRVAATDGEDATPPIDEGRSYSSVKRFAFVLLTPTFFFLLR